MAQMTPAQMRAQAEAALKPLGSKRIKLLAQIEEIDAQLKPLVRSARDVEVPFRRIAEITGVAPNTARAWSKPE
ncbi:hypothetical protein ACGFX7_26960 [Streptomyces harbinensis]|uniref:hypothetical protein n=1 Tax=Streptomyces harbinensis TaxID=1176198 RepID=UPI003718552A